MGAPTKSNNSRLLRSVTTLQYIHTNHVISRLVIYTQWASKYTPHSYGSAGALMPKLPSYTRSTH